MSCRVSGVNNREKTGFSLGLFLWYYPFHMLSADENFFEMKNLLRLL